MIERNTRWIGLAVGAGMALGLTGCSTVELEMSGSTTYQIEPSGFGPGPSLVAGDQLAFHMMLAGAYDAPSVFGDTGFATAPTDTD